MTDDVEGTTRFLPSLRIWAIRTLCAAIVWCAVVAFAPPPSGAAPMPLASALVAMPIVVAGASVLWGVLAWLGGKGVPYVGLFALPAIIAVVVGDPLLFVLHAATRSKWPDVVPVRSVGFVNLAAFLVAVETPDSREL